MEDAKKAISNMGEEGVQDIAAKAQAALGGGKEGGKAEGGGNPLAGVVSLSRNPQLAAEAHVIISGLRYPLALSCCVRTDKRIARKDTVARRTSPSSCATSCVGSRSKFN